MKWVNQTLVRIGSGLTAMAALSWVLWPSSFEQVVSNPEPIFVFVIALITWILTEYKQSEEVLQRESSPNDVRVAREIISLHAEEFRILLKDTDLFQLVPSDYYSKLNTLCDRFETGRLEFQNMILNKNLELLISDLDALGRFVAQHTVPEMIGGTWRTGFKPVDIVQQDRYDELIALSQEANEMATKAWRKLDALVSSIKTFIPEALDDRI